MTTVGVSPFWPVAVFGAAVSFLQVVTPHADEGLRISYELRPSGPMILNGLQISLLMPAERFAGERLIIGGEEGPQRSVALPQTLNADRWQLGTVKGSQVQLGAEADTALTLETDKAYDLVLHDLRRWDREEFEIRIPIIAAEQGEMVTANNRWDIEISLAPGPIEITGP